VSVILVAAGWALRRVALAYATRAAIRAAEHYHASACAELARLGQQLELARRSGGGLTPAAQGAVQSNWNRLAAHARGFESALRRVRDGNEIARLRGETYQSRIAEVRSDAAAMGLFLD
jgi:hypothetical protein